MPLLYSDYLLYVQDKITNLPINLILSSPKQPMKTCLFMGSCDWIFSFLCNAL